MTKILIDADSIIWQSGKVPEAMEDTEHGIACALYNTKRKLNKMTLRLNADETVVYLTKRGTHNFRYDIYPEYKANRKDVEKPIHFDKIFDYMVNKYDTVEAIGEEADDAVAIQMYKEHPNGFDKSNKSTILCHIDKDLNMVPGWHYNWMKDEEFYITPIQGLRFFYLQLLTGDTADNVPRIKHRWLKKKTEDKLNQADTEEEMLDIVLTEAYNVTENHEIEQLIEHRGQLLWMRTKEEEMWQLPEKYKMLRD